MAAGAPPNPAIWGHQVGGGGWGGQRVAGVHGFDREIEHGRPRPPSHHRAAFGYGLSFTYGRVEARIKQPVGTGLNSAFWTLGSNINTVGYPQSGEIDIVEYLGNGPIYHVGLHGPLQASPSVQWQRGADPTTGADLSAGYHAYWVEKVPERITVGIDEITTGSVGRSDLDPGEQWVFETPSNVLLNTAVGGNFAGPVPASTQFPTSLLVDHVRYYQYETSAQTPPVVTPPPVVIPPPATAPPVVTDPGAAFAASLAAFYQQVSQTFATALSNFFALFAGPTAVAVPQPANTATAATLAQPTVMATAATSGVAAPKVEPASTAGSAT